MFKCNECDYEFCEPAIIRERVPYGEGFANLPDMACCPRCGGHFEKLKICEFCGDGYVDSRHDGVCDSCINIVKARFSELLNQNFTKFEIDILNDVYDGRNLE